MTDAENEERVDNLIRSLAADYNQPPAEVPRTDIWAAIEAARATAAAKPARAVLPLYRRRWVPLAAGLAATLLIGVGIGRWLPTAEQSRGVSRSTDAKTASTLPAEDTRRTHVDAPLSTTYEVATAQHLGRVEALLTSFRTQSNAGGDREVAAWARDLLSTTRLLLDSPVGGDPQRRRLLEDLELVLAQIVLLAPDKAGEERTLIERSLEKDDVMTRLRAAIPADVTI
ncbi:MAG: hypothetical protein ABR543_03005 [Gemmatimonadaceae bacterium]